MAFDAFVSYSHAADGMLAPALHREIQRFAKPWYRARALRVFRDESALSAGRNLTQAEWKQFVGSTIPYHRTWSEWPAGT